MKVKIFLRMKIMKFQWQNNQKYLYIHLIIEETFLKNMNFCQEVNMSKEMDLILYMDERTKEPPKFL